MAGRRGTLQIMQLEKYSIGIGDRFAQQGKAQLQAILQADREGIRVTPVWNKSYREHSIVGSTPGDVRREADQAVTALGWKGPYRVDADHIGLRYVDLFVESSDFFTLDVADFTGRPALEEDIEAFVAAHAGFCGRLTLPNLPVAFQVDRETIRAAACKYLRAVQEAGRISRHLDKAKGKGRYVTEVSMDETDVPQSPLELFFILAAIAGEGIPAQTIAPKFTGRFNKGVDYVGSAQEFAREFEQHLAVVARAVEEFDLPANLKISVHSGSDKFSIYGPIRAALKKCDAGLHLKTAGTTWLEELIGLALAGGEGLAVAREVYRGALEHFEELCLPYAPVIDIDRQKLPSIEAVSGWSGEQYAQALRHDPSRSEYNPHFRQLLHVGYKIAAGMGERYIEALKINEQVVAENVTLNLYERHIKPVFGGWG
jgi:tagaturonate epimerase